MKIDNLIEIMARLSDAQELIARERTQEAFSLLDDTKRELFFRAHDEANSGLSFSDWCKANGIFATFKKPGEDDNAHTDGHTVPPGSGPIKGGFLDPNEPNQDN